LYRGVIGTGNVLFTESDVSGLCCGKQEGLRNGIFKKILGDIVFRMNGLRKQCFFIAECDESRWCYVGLSEEMFIKSTVRWLGCN
jgi:hypothetical protein